MSRATAWPISASALLLFSLAGCGRSSAPTVVLYTSVDEPVARPLIEQFQRDTGIQVLLQTDVEAAKTAGLAQRLRAERDNPQADVWWGNEIFHTIALANEGVLAPYDSPASADIPPVYKDPDHLWAATALRARVLVVSATSPRPVTRVEQLAEPWLKDKLAMARPAFGTTGGHVAALYVLWGDAKADAFFTALHANGLKLLGGNSLVAQFVGDGQLYAGLTDNDDADDDLSQGGKLQAVLPDQGHGEMGTLTMPCTVALVAGAPHPDTARRLIDFLLARATEQHLIDAHFAKYSVFAGAGGPQCMHVDYREVARQMPRAIEKATAILEGQ